MSERVSAAPRRAVAVRAHYRCEYRGMSEAESVVPHDPDEVSE
jgi:hypothetical protein